MWRQTKPRKYFQYSKLKKRLTVNYQVFSLLDLKDATRIRTK